MGIFFSLFKKDSPRSNISACRCSNINACTCFRTLSAPSNVRTRTFMRQDTVCYFFQNSEVDKAA